MKKRTRSGNDSSLKNETMKKSSSKKFERPQRQCLSSFTSVPCMSRARLGRKLRLKIDCKKSDDSDTENESKVSKAYE